MIFLIFENSLGSKLSGRRVSPRNLFCMKKNVLFGFQKNRCIVKSLSLIWSIHSSIQELATFVIA